MAVQSIEEMVRIHPIDIEQRWGEELSVTDDFFQWLLEHACDLLNRYKVPKGNRTAWACMEVMHMGKPTLHSERVFPSSLCSPLFYVKMRLQSKKLIWQFDSTYTRIVPSNLKQNDLVVADPYKTVAMLSLLFMFKYFHTCLMFSTWYFHPSIPLCFINRSLVPEFVPLP